MMKIGVNVSKRLAKIRNGAVYSSSTTVVTELLQNTQRAGATRIDLTVTADGFVLVDNGKGCASPEDVFTMDSSGWGLEEAFGEGFFSTFTIADHITVDSIGWHAEVDVLHLLEEDDLSVTVTPSTFQTGFRVKLTGDWIRQNWDELLSAVYDLAKSLPLDVYVNGNYVPHVPVLPTDTPEHGYRVETDLFEAVLTPAHYSSFHLYYEHRPVSQVYMADIGGTVVLKPGAVTLQAPDRQSIVWDDKRSRFYDVLGTARMELYRRLVAENDPIMVKSYARQIADYVPVEEYADLLAINDLGVTEEMMEELEHKTNHETETTEMEAPAYIGNPGYVGTVDDDRLTEETHESLTAERPVSKKERQQRIKDIKKRVAWVREADLLASAELITKLRYYGVDVLIAPNELYEKAYAHYGFTSLFDVDFEVRKSHKCTRVGIETKKEARARWLLQFVDEKYGVPNLFTFGNVTRRRRPSSKGRSWRRKACAPTVSPSGKA